ncbi:hypothetical protein KI387_000358, partial [Taxus chinensis]
VEVKPGQSLVCSAGEDRYTHLSQVALGEGSKSDERVAVYIHMDEKKIMIGSCLRGSCDQFGLDLILEKKFNVSHSSKTANDESESDDDDEIVPSVLTTKENGSKQPGKPEKAKKFESGPVAMPEKPIKGVLKVKPETPKQPAKVDNDESDDEESDDDDDEAMEDVIASEDDEEDDEDDSDEDDDDDDDDDDDESDESDEETPKAPVGKKRPAPDSVTKTPVTDKKAKVFTPEGRKTGDNKKNVHVATPHPGAKQGKKKGMETPGGPKQQTPVSKETPKSNASTPATLKKFGCQPCQ